jgi:hypothetical protein
LATITLAVPLVARAPVHAPVAVQLVEFVEVQLSWTEVWGATVATGDTRSTVGTLVVVDALDAGEAGAALSPPPPHPAVVIVARATKAIQWARGRDIRGILSTALRPD